LHELSLALEIRRMAEERLPRAQLPLLATVGLEVGDGSGVDADSLRFCLEAVFAEPPFAGARPVLERLPGDVLRLTYLEVDDGRPDD
jgi:Zn finger protein HypA/HybF involved in hydrogenase expression